MSAAAVFNPLGKHAWLLRDESLSDALLVLVEAEPGCDNEVGTDTYSGEEANEQLEPLEAAHDTTGQKQEACSGHQESKAGDPPALTTCELEAASTAVPEAGQPPVAKGQAMPDAQGIEAGAELPEGLHLPVHRAILASHSEYFKARVSSNWTAANMNKHEGRQVLVEQVEPEMVSAAEAVVWLMYKEVVHTELTPVEVAKMCTVADRWAATMCLGYCLDWLIQRPDQDLSCAQLAELLPQLPESIRSLPHHPAWEERCMKVLMSGSFDTGSNILPILLYLFGDVHALLTDSARLKRFLQLPYSAIKAWAGSDDLVVDSENSVAVAVGVWIEAKVGGAPRACSKEQQEELSRLLRLSTMSTGFLLYKLQRLSWFQPACSNFECCVTSFFDATKPAVVDRAAAWHGPCRRRLEPEVLKKRACLAWDVPRSVLEARMASNSDTFYSSSIYVAGAGVQLGLSFNKADNSNECKMGVYVHLGTHHVGDIKLVELPCVLSLHYITARLVPSSEEPQEIRRASDTLTSKHGWGHPSVLTLSSPSDLDPHLVDGCLKLRLTIEGIP